MIDHPSVEVRSWQLQHEPGRSVLQGAVVGLALVGAPESVHIGERELG